MADVTREYQIEFTSNSQATIQALVAMMGAMEGLAISANEAKAAVAGVDTGAQQASAGTSRLSTSLMGMGAGFAVLSEVRSAVGAIADGLEKAREYAEKTAAANMKLRDSLRELDYLKNGGKGGDRT